MHDESAGHGQQPPPYGAPPPSPLGGGPAVPPGGPSGYQPPPSNVLATISLGSGITSAVSMLVCCPLASMLGLWPITMGIGTVAGIAALVTGFMGLGQAKSVGVGKGPSIGGIVTGAISLLTIVLLLILALTVGAAVMLGALGSHYQ